MLDGWVDESNVRVPFFVEIGGRLCILYHRRSLLL